MGDWVRKIKADIKRGSITQLLFSTILAFTLMTYLLSTALQPLTNTILLYWEDGFTTEELERSDIHRLCENYTQWPMSTFLTQSDVMLARCEMMRDRHALRTKMDWDLYQDNLKRIRAQAKKRKEIQRIPPPPPHVRPNVPTHPDILPLGHVPGAPPNRGGPEGKLDPTVRTRTPREGGLPQPRPP